MAALTAAIDDEAQEVEDYSAEFDSVSSFASVAGSPRAAAVAAGEDYSTDSFASFAGSPRAAQVVADDYSEDFESPRAAAAAAGEDYSADFDESYSAEFDNASDDDSLASWQSLDRARAEARNVSKKRQRELEALMVAAAAAGDRYLLLTHLSEGARANASDEDGRTALSLACAEDKADAVTCLLQHGALCTRRDKDGRTPLWTACLKGSVECIAALAQYEGIQTTFDVTYRGLTCAYAAASSGNKDAVCALAGVDPLCVQRRCGDRDALACAAERGDATACGVLLEVARWETPVMGATPLERALQAGFVDCASFLLAKMAFSVDLLKGDAKRPSLKRRCFEAAVRSQQSDVLTWVLTSTDVAALPGCFGEHPTKLTPLVYCIVRAPPLVGVVIERLNCDVSEPSGPQRTPPLLVAAVRGAAEACARLLQRGADPFCADGNGATAVEMAELTEARSAFPQLLALPALPPDRWYAKEEADVRVEPITGGRWRRRVDESYASYGDSFESFRGTPLPSPGDSYAQDSFHTPELSRSRPESERYSATFEAEPLGVGTRVEARYEGGDEWYAGVIEGVDGDMYDVLYDDGDRETGLDKTLIRREIALDASYSNAFESLRASDSTLPGRSKSIATQAEVLEPIPEQEVTRFPRSAVAPAARELASKMEAVMQAIDRPPSDPLTYLRALHANKRDDAPPASPDGVEATPAGVNAYLRALRFYTTTGQ